MQCSAVQCSAVQCIVISWHAELSASAFPRLRTTRRKNALERVHAAARKDCRTCDFTVPLHTHAQTRAEPARGAPFRPAPYCAVRVVENARRRRGETAAASPAGGVPTEGDGRGGEENGDGGPASLARRLLERRTSLGALQLEPTLDGSTSRLSKDRDSQGVST